MSTPIPEGYQICDECGGNGFIDAHTFGEMGWHSCYRCAESGYTKMKTITIEMYRGCYSDIHGLPDGWSVAIRDLDEGIDNHNRLDEFSVRLTVHGGCLTDVENLPDGYDYEIEEKD